MIWALNDSDLRVIGVSFSSVLFHVSSWTSWGSKMHNMEMMDMMDIMHTLIHRLQDLKASLATFVRHPVQSDAQFP